MNWTETVATQAGNVTKYSNRLGSVALAGLLLLTRQVHLTEVKLVRVRHPELRISTVAGTV